MKCDHCPSLFHTSSQCKLGPKSLKRTPSEEISKSRIEDYFVFTDKVNESKKLLSPFSFSLDSLAENDGFYIDKERSIERQDSGRSQDVMAKRDVSRERDQVSVSQQSSMEKRSKSEQRNNYNEQRNNYSDQRTFTSRNYDHHRRSGYKPLALERDKRDERATSGSSKYGERSDHSRSVSELSFTIQNDHEGGSQRPNIRAVGNNYTLKNIQNTEKSGSVALGNEHKRFKVDDKGRMVGGKVSEIDNQESSRNSKDTSNKSIQEKGSDFTRITVDINSNDKSLSADTVKDKSNGKESQANTEVSNSHDSLSIPRTVKITPSHSFEISLENNQDKSPNGVSCIAIESGSSSSQNTPCSKSTESKYKEKNISDSPDNSNGDVKNLSYHHMKYEIKRRNAYAELDASISLEMSKMNSTISELEVVLFENAPKLLDETSSILSRLKSQRNCLKQLKDTYLKQLNEIEDQESTFIQNNLESISVDSRKRNASDADLVSEDVDGSEKQKLKISLNSSSSSKKDRINEHYVQSIFDDSNTRFPSNSRDMSTIFSSSNGLSLVSSILDGKPRSGLFPPNNVEESLDGILFSSTLENKIQVWDIPTFSPIKSISFHGEREKGEKVSLPEDMCWVSKNSILISSRKTEKLQDQEWNNLTLLYDLRRSVKPGGFKYKILNFKEHGHGAISVIKGISNSIQKTTRWITGGYNNKVYMWTIGDLSADTTLDSKLLMNEHTSTVSAFHYCTHKEFIYSGGIDGKIFGYNLDGVVQSSFSVKPKKIRDIHQIGSNPSTLLVTAADRESEFLIYDALKNAPVMQFGSKKELTTADGKFERVRSMYQHSAVHPNGYLVCMGDHNTSKINMWDIRKPNVPLQFDVHEKGQTDKGKSKYLSLVLGFHTSGGKQYLYSLGSDKRIVRIDLGSVF